MIFYNSQYLSRHLGINSAKWKRWSRIFLPPDPLGGLQSGFARQFNLKEAFKVYLGGYLVGELKFTIPDAQQILSDLSGWLKSNGFFSIPSRSMDVNTENGQHHIYIFCNTKGKFSYSIRTVHSLNPAEDGTMQQTFSQILIASDKDPIASGLAKSAHLLSITSLYRHFIGRID